MPCAACSHHGAMLWHAWRPATPDPRLDAMPPCRHFRRDIMLCRARTCPQERLRLRTAASECRGRMITRCDERPRVRAPALSPHVIATIVPWLRACMNSH
eukprot:6477986-Alexandrium_andersonii.AAC.1